MGGGNAATKAKAQEPIYTAPQSVYVPPTPVEAEKKKKIARGGFFGAEGYGAALTDSSARRSTFLGG